MRLHSTTLYSSLFRYDDEIMVNPHAYGEPALDDSHGGACCCLWRPLTAASAPGCTSLYQS